MLVLIAKTYLFENVTSFTDLCFLSKEQQVKSVS